MDAEAEPIRALVRKLAARYDRRYWLECAHAGRHVDAMWRALGEAGVLGVTVPEAYGGSGPSLARLCVAVEELASCGVPTLFLVVSTAMAALPIARHGSEAQKRRYLPRLADGSEKFCFALTEPDAGSNSFALRTTARRDGASYVLRGQKVFITGASDADHVLVVARTGDGEDARARLSLLLVPAKAPGIELRAMDIRMVAPEQQFEVFLDDVRVPVEARLGDEGAGGRIMFDALNPERVTVAALACGLGRYALAKAVAYAKERAVFRGPIGAYQSIAHPLAEVATDLELAALMAHHAAARFDAGDDAAMLANMAKLAAAEAGIAAVDRAIQVHGGAGFTAEVDLITLWPLVRLFRTAPVSRELILNHIAEHGLGLPRSH
ncbi:MAG TPA: acyl-CoA dehydrogenase family protein [Kofleriaceae bacterium]|nr:acyl-CoA dehydrogenase family protein [Kofleriaceae bacterium]